MSQLVDLFQIKGDGPGALPAQGFLKSVGRDERVAVPVAADPAADLEERKQWPVRRFRIQRREPVLELGVEARQFLEESVFEIGHAVGHFVEHVQARLAQLVGLPQHQNVADHFLVDVGEFVRGPGSGLTPRQQFGDADFAQHRALAPHLGRVRGQHSARCRRR